jgi:hypothetical protein
MDLVALVKERIADLEKKLGTAVNQRVVREALEHNKKLLKDLLKKNSLYFLKLQQLQSTYGGFMVEETIRQFMGEDHIETTMVVRKDGVYAVTPQPLKYTESMTMMDQAMAKLSPKFIELWNSESGWYCNLVVDGITYKSENEPIACFAMAKALYNYIRRDYGRDRDDCPEFTNTITTSISSDIH